MGVIHVDLPESILLSTGQSQDEFVRDAKFFVALKLFELGRISSGRAAEICNLSRVEFILLAGRWGVPVADLDAEEPSREFGRQDQEAVVEEGRLTAGTVLEKVRSLKLETLAESASFVRQDRDAR